MSQYLTSCQIMQNASKQSKHTSLLNGGVTCNMTLNDGLLFWSDHLANLYKFKLPSWVVDQSVCNDWWSHGGNTNFHFCLSPKSPSPTSFSINSNYHALTTCNRQHASGIKNWQYMWMPRQCIFRTDHSTVLWEILQSKTLKLLVQNVLLWIFLSFVLHPTSKSQGLVSCQQLSSIPEVQWSIGLQPMVLLTCVCHHTSTHKIWPSHNNWVTWRSHFVSRHLCKRGPHATQRCYNPGKPQLW
jgi:hypothetical protein